MKDGIHPTYTKEAAITCACGKNYTVGSTSEKIAIELCSNCHPFYTGKQKIVDSARRVEKFQARTEQTGTSLTHADKLAKKAERAQKKADKKAKEAEV
ncbi:MAG: 50S ribosomal protein L31 [bacterium]|nr:50S ribosomal protein L31 [bacterium]MDA1024668.1 50S ribosomal protein L31 [bacterium]